MTRREAARGRCVRDDVESKFRGLVEDRGDRGGVEELIGLTRDLRALCSVGELNTAIAAWSARRRWSSPADPHSFHLALFQRARWLYEREQHGGSRRGAVSKAVEALVDRGEIAGDDTTATGMRLVDPLLAAWINEGRMGV